MSYLAKAKKKEKCELEQLKVKKWKSETRTCKFSQTFVVTLVLGIIDFKETKNSAALSRLLR